MTGRKFNFETELDEMHRAVLSVLPEKLLDLSDIAVTREGLDALMSQMPSPELPEHISIESVHVPDQRRVPVGLHSVSRGLWL